MWICVQINDEIPDVEKKLTSEILASYDIIVYMT